MGRKHSREEILEGALQEALEEGVSRLSFGRVAKRLGIPDRTVVYYFPTKDDLVREVLGAMGAQLQEMLAPVFGGPPAESYEPLMRLAWPLLATPKADRLFSLFFEANGLAAAGREPYATLVPAFVEAWTTAVAGVMTGSAKKRRTEAEAAIALLDGLLLLRQLGGPAAADRAARRLGVR